MLVGGSGDALVGSTVTGSSGGGGSTSIAASLTSLLVARAAASSGRDTRVAHTATPACNAPARTSVHLKGDRGFKRGPKPYLVRSAAARAPPGERARGTRVTAAR